MSVRARMDRLLEQFQPDRNWEAKKGAGRVKMRKPPKMKYRNAGMVYPDSDGGLSTHGFTGLDTGR